MGEYDSPSCWYDDQVSFMQDLESPRTTPHHPYNAPYHHPNCKPELELQYNNIPHDAAFLQLPQLESPKVTTPSSSATTASVPYGHAISNNNINGSTSFQFSSSSHTQQELQIQQYYLHHQQSSLQHSLFGSNEQVTDWRVLDKFVASQLSHDDQDVSKESTTSNFSNAAILHVAEQITLLANGSKKAESSQEHASTTSTSSCHMELWK